MIEANMIAVAIREKYLKEGFNHQLKAINRVIEALKRLAVFKQKYVKMYL